MMISERIFSIMKKQKMSQKEFSQRTGIPESTISDWKHRNNTPGADKIMDICNVLHVSPYDLLAEDEAEKPSETVVDMSTDLGLLIEVCKNLTEEQQSRVLGYAQGIAAKNESSTDDKKIIVKGRH